MISTALVLLSLVAAPAPPLQEPAPKAQTSVVTPEAWPVLTPADDPFMVAMPADAELKREEDPDGTVRRVYAARKDGQAFVVVSTAPPAEHLATVRALSAEQMFDLATGGIVSDLRDEGLEPTATLARTLRGTGYDGAEGTISLDGKTDGYRARIVRTKDRYFFLLVTMTEDAKAKERAARFFETFQTR